VNGPHASTPCSSPTAPCSPILPALPVPRKTPVCTRKIP
jgi:hypothetical protein